MMTTDVDVSKIIKIRLYNLRCVLDMSQHVLADKIGVSQCAISNIESGRCASTNTVGISVKALADISRATGVSLDWLLGLTGENAKPMFVNEVVRLEAPKLSKTEMLTKIEVAKEEAAKEEEAAKDSDDTDLEYVKKNYPHIFQTVDYKLWKKGTNIADVANVFIDLV